MGILDKTKSSSQKTDHECVCAHAEVVHLFLFSTLWTIARQFPLSMRFSRQEYWSGLPCPSPWNLPKPDIEPSFPTLQADSLPSEPPGKLQSMSGKQEVWAGPGINYCGFSIWHDGSHPAW